MLKLKENSQDISRLQNGLERLTEANENVEKLKLQLQKEEPELRQTEEEVKIMLAKISQD